MASPIKALLIEDNVEDIGHTVGYLEREAPQISLAVANSLSEAKSRLSAQNFECVIIDHDPPDGNSIEFLGHLKELGNNAIPIFITEYGNYGMLNDIFQQGVVYHVTKGDCYWECLPLLLEQAVNFSRMLAEERAAHQATPAALAEKRDHLMSRVAHEVKTPLTAILGFSQMLMTKPDAAIEKRQKWANFVHSKGQQLSRLIDNMLDLSEMQTGQQTISKRPSNLNTLINDAIAEMGVLAPTRVIESHVPAELPNLDIDTDRILQVIVNLLTNADSITPEGVPIRLQVHEGKNAIEVEVTDHGPTLPPELRENIFEPFSAEPGGGPQAGKGLWLPLAQRVIEAHGGRLWLEPAPPQGSTFIFTLPQR